MKLKPVRSEVECEEEMTALLFKSLWINIYISTSFPH